MGKNLLSFIALLVAFSVTCGQGSSYQEKFRQATEAMRAGKLDEAGNEFASITKEFPSYKSSLDRKLR